MSVLLVGVCVVLWGKEGDEEENIEEKLLEIVKCCEITGVSKMARIDEEVVDVEMQYAVKAKMAVGFS